MAVAGRNASSRSEFGQGIWLKFGGAGGPGAPLICLICQCHHRYHHRRKPEWNGVTKAAPRRSAASASRSKALRFAQPAQLRAAYVGKQGARAKLMRDVA